LIVSGWLLPHWFVRDYGRLTLDDNTVCSRAMRSKKTVQVYDVTHASDLGTLVPVALRMGFRGVLAAPLITSHGKFLGVISTHFANPHNPTAIEIEALEHFCPIVADRIAGKTSNLSVSDVAERFYARLLLASGKKAVYRH